MDLFDAITRRYSYRGEFDGQPLPRDHLEKIIDAGIRAPSGGNAQTTSFVGVLDADIRQKIAGIIQKPTTKTAPAIIAVVTENREIYAGKAFEKEDYGAAVENMLLAVTALGYATVWVDGYLKDNGNAARLAALLGLPAGQTVRAILPIGVPKDPGAQAARLPFGQRATIL